METIESKKIGKMLTLDLNIYSVLINKSELNEDTRLYFICDKNQLNNSFDHVDAYFAKVEGHTISAWFEKGSLLKPAGPKQKINLIETLYNTSLRGTKQSHIVSV